MLSAFHELLVNDLAGIVLSSLDVDGLLDNGIRAAAQSTTCAILAGDDCHGLRLHRGLFCNESSLDFDDR